MIVKTKKNQLEHKTYRKIGLRNIMRTQWWLPLSIFLGIILLNLLLNTIYRNTWIYFLAPVGVGIYYLFWWVQFTGVTQLKQYQVLFEKLSYEIDSRQILMKKNAKEGMQIKWEMIKSAEKTKDAFLLYLSKAQFIFLPFKAFNSDNDIRFTESLLKRKNLLK